MAIHIRNLLSADSTVATLRFSAYYLILLREIFLAGRWTQSAISNPASWDTNIVLTNTDCVVSAASPGRITSATGGFTGYEDYGFTLMGGVADADDNRGVFRVKSIVSDNEIEVYNPPLEGWVSDTGMTCRIFNWGITSPLLNAEYVVMDPPVGNNQAYLGKPSTDYVFYFQACPRGTYPLNLTPTRSISMATSARNAMWHAYFDDSVAFVYFFDNYNTQWYCILYGELTNVFPTDTYPGFFAKGTGTNAFDLGSFSGQLGDLDMYFDNGGGDIGQISARVTNIVQPNVSYLSQQQAQVKCHRVKGKLQVLQPWVYMLGTNGGYFRGMHPFRTTNVLWSKFRPVTPQGTWRHHEIIGVFPMNGVSDPRPITATPIM